MPLEPLGAMTTPLQPEPMWHTKLNNRRVKEIYGSSFTLTWENDVIKTVDGAFFNDINMSTIAGIDHGTQQCTFTFGEALFYDGCGEVIRRSIGWFVKPGSEASPFITFHEANIFGPSKLVINLVGKQALDDHKIKIGLEDDDDSVRITKGDVWWKTAQMTLNHWDPSSKADTTSFTVEYNPGGHRRLISRLV